ncbi:hypothetical protein GCM10009865_13960 [Aeromicrobium ponti]
MACDLEEVGAGGRQHSKFKYINSYLLKKEGPHGNIKKPSPIESGKGGNNKAYQPCYKYSQHDVHFWVVFKQEKFGNHTFSIIFKQKPP